MRNTIFALVMAFSISVPQLLFAAELPPLDQDFPAQWTKIFEKVCTPKAGIELKRTIYLQQANNEMTKAIALEEKNGAGHS